MHLSPSSSSTRKGFTLVELITVIAIILFLVGLLMPSLRRAVETAKLTKCISNIRQIGQATMLYAADNGGFAPFGPDNYWKDAYFVARSHNEADPSYADGYPKNKWFAEYLPVGKLGEMTRVAYCPMGGRYGNQGAVFTIKEGKETKVFNNVSYGINPSLIQTKWFYGDDTNPGGSDDRYCVPLSQVKYPGQTCLWIEGARSKLGWPQRDGVSGRHYARSKEVSKDKPTDSGFVIWEERGKAPVVFVDQHIEALKMREEVPASNDRFWEHTSTVSVRMAYDKNPYQ
jgi:prepilin-type N-terminal cleavage/methylation domain-containing protein